MPLNDDTAETFIGAREQDNEALAFEQELTTARGKDAEIQMASLSETLQQQVQGALPKADGTVPEAAELPDANGDMEPIQEGVQIDESDFISEVPSIIGDVAANLPKNVTVGTIRAAKEAFNAVIPGGLERADAALVDMGAGDYVEAMNGFMGELENGAGTGDKIVQELAQFAVPFSLYMKGIGAATKMGTISKALTADAMASFFNLDPHMDRLSTVLQEVGVHNEFVSYLADESGTDTENRFRNVLENQAMGAAIGGSIFAMVKTFKGMMWAGKKLPAAIKKGAK